MAAGYLSAGGKRKVAGKPGRRGARPQRRSRWFPRNAANLSRVIAVIFISLLLMLQYRLWVGDGGVNELLRLKQDIAAQKQQNDSLRERNEALEAEVLDLKQGEAAIEERARRELGMIRGDETFYLAIDE